MSTLSDSRHTVNATVDNTEFRRSAASVNVHVVVSFVARDNHWVLQLTAREVVG